MKYISLPLNPVFLFLIIGFLSSCATHNGCISSNAVLVDSNFRIIGLGVGEVKSVRVLGFGGLKKDALVFEAKSDLYKKVKLKPGQALTNITVDFKREFYFVFSKTKVIVTAEIVDFNHQKDDSQQNNYGITERNGYEIGEQVYVKIYGIYSLRKVEKIYLKGLQVLLDNNEVKNIKYEDSYRLEGNFEYKNKIYSIGDYIEISKEGSNLSGDDEIVLFTGKVAGISTKNALLIDSVNNRYISIRIE
jgi:hypothetical protein